MRQAKKQKGMTLIELMIVVAIVAILAAIAYPSYQQYVIRANRAAVQSFMRAIANKQEQFILDRRQYATGADIAAIVDALNISLPEGRVSDVYRVALTNRGTPANPRTYLITATPVTGSVQAGDGDLTLNEIGQKTPASKW